QLSARIDKILQRWHEKMEKVQSFSCQLQRTDADPSHKSARLLHGTMCFLQPNRFMLELRMKEETARFEKMVYDGRFLYAFDRGHKQIFRFENPFQAGQDAAWLDRSLREALARWSDTYRTLFFGAPLAEMKRRYRIELASEDQWYIGLLFLPRNSQDDFMR